MFDILAIWRKQPILAAVGYFNLVGAAISIPFAIATGLGAWQWQLEGATLKGNLRLHMICALITAALITDSLLETVKTPCKGTSTRINSYFVIIALGLMMITLTGHLGGILSGVEAP